jgi:hypothetical protein
MITNKNKSPREKLTCTIKLVLQKIENEEL